MNPGVVEWVCCSCREHVSFFEQERQSHLPKQKEIYWYAVLPLIYLLSPQICQPVHFLPGQLDASNHGVLLQMSGLSLEHELSGSCKYGPIYKYHLIKHYYFICTLNITTATWDIFCSIRHTCGSDCSGHSLL